MYKKGIGILLVLAMVFMLGACGSKEEKRVFEMKEDGIAMTVTYYYKGDKVTKQTTKNVMNYDAIGVPSKEAAKEILDPLSDMFKDVEGIKEKIDYGEYEVTEVIEVDYEKIDLDEAKGLPGMMLDGDTKNGISMKKSAEMLLDQGFEEK